MKKNKLGIMIAAFAVFIAGGIICVMSVRVGRREGYLGAPFAFSFGGKAKLQNTIEIPLSKADKLKLEYGSKNIRVYPAENDVITVREYLYSGSQRALAETVFGSDGEALIRGGNNRSFVIFGFFVGEGERIEVYVPEKSLREFSIQSGSGNITSETDCTREDGAFSLQAGSGNIRLSNAGAKELSLVTGSGNIRAEKLDGEGIRMKAGSGNIHVEDMTGNVTLQTGSGNIDGNRIEGAATINSGSGNIRIEELAGSAKAEARSGNVTVKVQTLSGDIELSTGSGNVRLELPEEADFHFSGESRSGNIRTDFDNLLSYNQKGNSAGGAVGENPDININVKTGSGNMNILYR